MCRVFFRVLLSVLDHSPHRVLAVLCLTCISMLAFGLYLQHHLDINPCPMCIVQRYALLSVAVISGLMSLVRHRAVHVGGAIALLLVSGFGAGVAMRQTWLQWYPPLAATCGRDFYGMIEAFPLSRVVPMIFKGSGDCAAVDWTFLGGSLALWSAISFSMFFGLSALMLWRNSRRPRADRLDHPSPQLSN